jgi:phage terminase large subunit
VVLKRIKDWSALDPGVSARTALGECQEIAAKIELNYDSVGVGAAVKAEANRLKEEGLFPKTVTMIPWNGGFKVLDPQEPVNPDDPKSPRNKDFYHNLKAQGWWMLRQRCYKTWRMVMGLKGQLPDGTPMAPVHYEPEELISLPSTLPNLRQVKQEMSQPTAGKSTTLKMKINKTPDGTRSPNLGDVVMMCYWPLPNVPDIVVGMGPRVFVGGEPR